MHSLDITFQMLASSTNEAAIGVLGVALVDPEESVRRRAIEALVKRKESRCGEILLANWQLMTGDETRALRDELLRRSETGQIVFAVTAELTKVGENIRSAIQAAATLQRFELIPQLVDLAETHVSHAIRQSAALAVIELAEILGSQARDGHDLASIRGEALRRLVRSVEQLSLHRNRDLADAFLLSSTSGDSQLTKLLDAKSPHREVLLARLKDNKSASIAQLLASFIRRPKLQSGIAALIRTRSDETFRSALLEQVGSDPSGTTLQHLKIIGRPVCCVDDPVLAAALPTDEHAALLHVIAQTSESAPKLLRFAVSTILRDEVTTTEAATTVLSRHETLSVDFWMRTAIELAGDFDSRLTLGDDALLLGDLLDLLSHGKASVLHSVQHVLRPLQAESILPYMLEMRAHSRERLGHILLMIDPSAINLVRDRLRHPVLKNRLEAIAAADALGIVDLLADAFAHIIRTDHQEARRRVAAAMATASSNATLTLLGEMIAMPPSTARDEAVRSYDIRTQKTTTHCENDLYELPPTAA